MCKSTSSSGNHEQMDSIALMCSLTKAVERRKISLRPAELIACSSAVQVGTPDAEDGAALAHKAAACKQMSVPDRPDHSSADPGDSAEPGNNVMENDPSVEVLLFRLVHHIDCNRQNKNPCVEHPGIQSKSHVVAYFRWIKNTSCVSPAAFCPSSSSWGGHQVRLCCRSEQSA